MEVADPIDHKVSSSLRQTPRSPLPPPAPPHGQPTPPPTVTLAEAFRNHRDTSDRFQLVGNTIIIRKDSNNTRLSDSKCTIGICGGEEEDTKDAVVCDGFIETAFSEHEPERVDHHVLDGVDVKFKTEPLTDPVCGEEDIKKEEEPTHEVLEVDQNTLETAIKHETDLQDQSQVVTSNTAGVYDDDVVEVELQTEENYTPGIGPFPCDTTPFATPNASPPGNYVRGDAIESPATRQAKQALATSMINLLALEEARKFRGLVRAAVSFARMRGHLSWSDYAKQTLKLRTAVLRVKESCAGSMPSGKDDWIIMEFLRRQVRRERSRRTARKVKTETGTTPKSAKQSSESRKAVTSFAKRSSRGRLPLYSDEIPMVDDSSSEASKPSPARVDSSPRDCSTLEMADVNRTNRPPARAFPLKARKPGKLQVPSVAPSMPEPTASTGSEKSSSTCSASISMFKAVEMTSRNSCLAAGSGEVEVEITNEPLAPSFGTPPGLQPDTRKRRPSESIMRHALKRSHMVPAFYPVLPPNAISRHTPRRSQNGSKSLKECRNGDRSNTGSDLNPSPGVDVDGHARNHHAGAGDKSTGNSSRRRSRSSSGGGGQQKKRKSSQRFPPFNGGFLPPVPFPPFPIDPKSMEAFLKMWPQQPPGLWMITGPKPKMVDSACQTDPVHVIPIGRVVEKSGQLVELGKIAEESYHQNASTGTLHGDSMVVNGMQPVEAQSS